MLSNSFYDFKHVCKSVYWAIKNIHNFKKKEIIAQYVYFIRVFFLNVLIIKKVVQCPFCNWKGREFYPYPFWKLQDRKNVICPRCLSMERHRATFLLMIKESFFNNTYKVLHVAPEKSFEYFFKKNSSQYLSIDIDPKKAMRKEDITQLSFDDGSFDFICCSHVLEHIKDYTMGIKEINRVLTKTGRAILSVPFYPKLNKTIEYNEPDPDDAYHVRKIGIDYLDLLKNAGFGIVKYFDCEKSFSKNDMEKNGLLGEYIIFAYKEHII